MARSHHSRTPERHQALHQRAYSEGLHLFWEVDVLVNHEQAPRFDQYTSCSRRRPPLPGATNTPCLLPPVIGKPNTKSNPFYGMMSHIPHVQDIGVGNLRTNGILLPGGQQSGSYREVS